MQRKKHLFYFLSSFLIVAFAQPDWSAFACIAASACGYALFWKVLLFSTSRKKRFLQSMLWFAAVQAVQLSWLAADRYVGGYIFLFLIILFLALGLQFAVISLFVGHHLTIFRIVGISGGWTLFEWGRLCFLSGFSWNPSGIALSGTFYGMQMASIVGIFGMGFWIFLTNLCALKMFLSCSWRRIFLWGIVMLTPYLFGWAHVIFHKKEMAKSTDYLSALVVQTAIYPEYKISLNGSQPLSPQMQWERILGILFPYAQSHPDLIVFSESVVPYGAGLPIYSLETVKHAFETFFEKTNTLPTSSAPYVSNSYWAQALANQFSTNVVIGLEEFEKNQFEHSAQAYNAAFLFRPNEDRIERYEKRVLVPMGEYIPFDWCRKFLAKYGIEDSYCPGKEAKVFHANSIPIGISICYEETYGHLMRESRLKGAALLINLTNDVWYPRSRLPMVHFFHGQLRAIEAGIPLIRSCNTGVTCGVDSLGRIVGLLPYECAGHYCPADALALSLPLYHYPTVYTRYGDLPIILFSCFAFFGLCVRVLVKRKSFILNDLEVYLLRKN